MKREKKADNSHCIPVPVSVFVVYWRDLFHEIKKNTRRKEEKKYTAHVMLKVRREATTTPAPCKTSETYEWYKMK